jgi:membrane protease YdiL (CAAX protease family)
MRLIELRGLALYLLVVLTATLAQRVNDVFILVFLCACLVLPLFTGETRSLAQTLALRRAGWIIASLLAIGSFVGLYAANWITVKVYWGTILLQPALESQIAFCARQFAIYLPLAFAEEFFFRGYLQETVFAARWDARGWGFITRKNFAASALFGLAHIISHASLFELPRVLSGVILGRVVERSARSILPATFLHAASNVAVVWAQSLMV